MKPMYPDFTIDADFPGGNIIVEKVEDDHVYLHQDLRDTAGDWFYWAFQWNGPQSRRLRFHFTGGDVLGVRGPAVSVDAGASWRWLGGSTVSRDDGDISFSYDSDAGASKVLFAFCPLYTQNHLDHFLSRQNSSALRKSVFCHSRAGRPVELLEAGNPSAAARVLFTCRHHACEAMASYCLEGILEAVSGEDELGNWLRENVCIAALPFMDKDGVEQGDQGKNRRPHDHNRDYGGSVSDSIYPEVKTLREWAPLWAAPGKDTFLFDLHCPYIRGARNEEVHFVGGEDENIWRRVMEYAAILQDTRRGTIPFYTSNNLPFGSDWNTRQNYIIGKSCAKWAAELPGIHLAATIEIPYANAGNIPVTPQSSRALGRDMILALQRYLLN